jgi:hypothetical protein
MLPMNSRVARRGLWYFPGAEISTSRFVLERPSESLKVEAVPQSGGMVGFGGAELETDS